jgi:hypothetical protein
MGREIPTHLTNRSHRKINHLDVAVALQSTLYPLEVEI